MAGMPWSILSWRKDIRLFWVWFIMLWCLVDNCLQVAKLLEIVSRVVRHSDQHPRVEGIQDSQKIWIGRRIWKHREANGSEVPEL